MPPGRRDRGRAAEALPGAGYRWRPDACRGRDRCTDPVGTEAHGSGFIDSVVDNVKIEQGEIVPSFVVTHRLSLEDAPEAFRDKQDGCIKVVLKP